MMKVDPTDFESSCQKIQLLMDEAGSGTVYVMVQKTVDGWWASVPTDDDEGRAPTPWSGYFITAAPTSGAVRVMKDLRVTAGVGGTGSWKTFWLLATQSPQLVPFLVQRQGVWVQGRF